MKKLLYATAFLAMTLQLTNCKKSNNDDDSDNSTPTNTLCDGKGGNVWMPLDSTNHWDYEFTIASIHQGSPTLTAGGTSSHGGKTYRRIVDDSFMMYPDDYELREDAATHDIYKYNDNNGQEYLEVPGSPTVDQTWSLSSGYSRKITSVNATLTTGSCSYTGLLEMIERDASLNTTNTYYFKKGLGLIKKQQPGGFGNIYTLTGVGLK